MGHRVRGISRPHVRLMTTALLVTSVIALVGCGSDTSAKPSGTDAQRTAAGIKGTNLCVTGRTGSPMTVYLSQLSAQPGMSLTGLTENDRKQTGPFSLVENSCLTNDFGQVRGAVVHASVYDADGTREMSIIADNPGLGEPKASVVCTAGPSPTQETYEFSEGLRRTFECGQFEIAVERMTDSATEKHLQANISLR